MKVKEVIEWLHTQDQEADFEVVKHTRGLGYYDQGGNATSVDFDPSRHADYLDFTKNPHVGEDSPHFNMRFLLLGELNGDPRER